MYALLMYGTAFLFAAPNCTPWGNNAKQWPEPQRRERRAAESKWLQFLCVLCFLQVLMGRSYGIERPSSSDVMKDEEYASLHNLKR